MRSLPVAAFLEALDDDACARLAADSVQWQCVSFLLASRSFPVRSVRSRVFRRSAPETVSTTPSKSILSLGTGHRRSDSVARCARPLVLAARRRRNDARKSSVAACTATRLRVGTLAKKTLADRSGLCALERGQHPTRSIAGVNQTLCVFFTQVRGRVDRPASGVLAQRRRE